MRGILLVFSALDFRLNRSDLANQQDEYLMSDMLRIMRINKAYLGLFAFCLFELSYGDSLRSLPFGTLSVTVGQDAPAAPSEPAAPTDPKPADPKPAEPPAAEPVAGEPKASEPKASEPKAGEQQPDAPPRRDRRRFGPRGGRSEGQEPSAPADKPNEKPAETPAEKPAEKPEDKPAEKPAEKPEEKAPPESKDPSVDTRLNAIEMQLGEIAKMLQGLKASNADEKKESGSKEAGSKDSSSKEGKGKDAGGKDTQAESKPKWDGTIPKEWTKGIRWRSIGPASMGGRIVDLAVNEKDPNTWWAATASGGLIKTVNNGNSFVHQFDREATVSIGAVAVSQSNPDIVWVGTGENNPRNSVSYGDGVYKSTDGGKTWTNMGLKKTFQIGEVVIHPTNPDVVYVGALGRLYGNNEERGIFKTVDGGKTWERCFYIDDRTGVIEMQMSPADPDTLIVTAWERLRDGFDSWPGSEIPIPEGYGGYDPIRKWGPGSGLYKTTDGGKNWKKLTKGLPTSQMGRIGIDWYRKDPNVLFAVVDCENIGKGPAPLPVLWGAVGENRENTVVVTQVYANSPAHKAGLKVGDIIESINDEAISDFDRILDTIRDKKAGDTFKTAIKRGAESMSLEYTLVARGGSRGGESGGGGSMRTLGLFGAFGEDADEGLKIATIFPDSAAQKASLQADDVVTEFDGKKVLTWEELLEQLGGKNAGDKVKVKFIRSGESKEVEVTLETRQGGGGPGAGGGGAGGQSNPPQSSTYIGITGDNGPSGGAQLSNVTEGGPAQKAGVLKGDIIVAINDKDVADYRETLDALRGKRVGDKVKLKINRGAEVKEIEVTFENRPGPVRPYTASLGGQAPNAQDQQGAKGYEYGGIYKSTDGGESWTRINSLHSRPMYFSVVRVDPNDDKNVYLLGVSQFKSSDGGLTFDANLGRSVHADGHALWIDPRDGRHMIIGVDGGVYTTYDKGGRWDHLNTLALGQFYHVAIAPKYPYYVYGGLQDNGTWGGPAISLSGSGPVNEDWLSVGGGDGFMCRVDPNDPELVYWTSQDGNMGRRNMKTGERGSIRAVAPEGEPAYRFNWNTPFILSNFNSRVFYAAGNYVFRSWDRGSNLEKISPEITLTKRGSATALSESPRSANVLYVGTDDGALWVTRDAGKTWTDITKNLGLVAPRWVSTIEASRFADGRVYVCLDGHRSNDDDPYVMVSEDYGATFKSLRANLPWGSTRCLRESPFNENILLVGTEFGLFATANRGEAWSSLNSNLPTVAIFDLAFHPNNGEVVLATHGRSLWIADVSALHQLAPAHLTETPNLYKPTTAIRWRREATRGTTNRRFIGENPAAGAAIYYTLPKKAASVSLKILDVSGQTLREIRGSNEAGLQRVTWDLIAQGGRGNGGAGSGASGGGGGRGQRSGGGAEGASSSGESGRTGEAAGESAQGQTAASEAGENATAASSATPTAAQPQSPATTQQAAAAGGGSGQGRRGGGGGGASGGAGGGGPGGGGFGRGRIVSSGTYRIVLTVDGKEYSQELKVISDPNLPIQSELTGLTEEYEVWLGDVEEGQEGEEEEKEEEEQQGGAKVGMLDGEGASDL
jgi:S1-C subfamily serine protease/photosystem II stability/assembly factor-like uncharacterized protein